MNDQQIYELLAKAPVEGLRAVQVCDLLDQELVDVSAALKSLVDVGDVVRTPGTAPNGQAAQFYTLSDTFKASREYKAFMALAAATPAPDNASAPMPAAPKKSRTDDAIEYIRHRGRVSTAELKVHMGLKSGEAPASWLAIPIRDGRLARDGAYWMIGAGPASTAGKAAKPTVARGAIPKLGTTLAAKSPKSPLERVEQPPAPEVPAPAPEAVAPPPAQAAGRFRCGIWSDGVLELQRDGVTLTELTRGEGEHMADFLGRMLRATAAPQVVADELALFESEMRKTWGSEHFRRITVFEGECYDSSSMNGAWAGWNAGRAALAAAPVPVMPADRRPCQYVDVQVKGGGIVRIDAAGNAAPVQAQEPFGTYIERDDGTTEFQRVGKAFQGTAYGYKAWTLYSAPVQPVAMAVPVDLSSIATYNWDNDGMEEFGDASGEYFHAETVRNLLAAPAAQGDTITLTRDELVDHRNQAFEQGVCEGKDQAAQVYGKNLTDDEIDAIALVECPQVLQTAGSLRRLVRAAISAKAVKP